MQPMDMQSEIRLGPYTTIRMGGPARRFAEPESREEIRHAVHWARDNGLPILPLGRGSNVVISDHGFNGLVLYLSRRYAAISWDGATAHCESGAPLHALVKESVRRGLQGVECLGWIPGTMGGAVVMNAGAFGQTIGDRVGGVETIDCATGQECSMSAPQLNLGYRSSALQAGTCVVLSVSCRLQPAANGKELEHRFKEIFNRRREKQPLDCPSCGSVFKNPAAQSAGALIEQSGLKGFRLGEMQVSDKHANFFVNRGGAAAEEFRRLTAHVQKSVYERFAVLLEPEVLFLGDFDAPLFSPR
jgi:UDP-N-acetylmuramate dehydrogenase